MSKSGEDLSKLTLIPTTREYGFEEDDIVIFCTKAKEIVLGAPDEYYIPSWFCCNLLTDNTHGIFIPAYYTVLCTWQEMIDYAILIMKSASIDKSKRRFFARCIPRAEIPRFNGMQPFSELEQSWCRFADCT